jgi:hypothetical protein
LNSSVYCRFGSFSLLPISSSVHQIIINNLIYVKPRQDHLMKLLYSLKESGNIDFQNAIDQIGTVYLTVPPNESGPGKVRVMVQGRLKIVTAYTKSGKKIASQRKVKVTELLDPRTLLVEPLGAETKEEKEQENA